VDLAEALRIPYAKIAALSLIVHGTQDGTCAASHRVGMALGSVI